MFLVVNLGLKSIRTIVFDERGEQVYSNSRPVHTTLFHHHVEQDSQEWLTLLDALLMDIKENTDLAEQITRITSTTSSSCIAGFDGSMLPLTKVMMVSDKRAVMEAEEIRSLGVYRSQQNELQLTCSASSVASKALWYKKHQPKIFDKVRWWLGAGEYLNYFFTHNIFTDPLNATKSFYAFGKYYAPVFDEIGLSVSTLPAVERIGSTVEVVKKIIEKYGFHPNVQYVLTTYDAICAVIGSSDGSYSNACDVSGTVTSVRVLSPHAIKTNSNVLLSQHIDLLDKFLIGASNNLGGGIIEWYKQAFFNDKEGDVYSKMENQAQSSKVGAGGIIFLPYLLGERAPFALPNAKATFFGVSRNNTTMDFTRAVFESTGFITRSLVELLQTNNIQIDTITVSGGMARFDIINQIKADVCNKPVAVVENFESTSVGAYMLMLIAEGIYSSVADASKEIVRIRKMIRPSPRHHEIYNKYYELFNNLNRALTDSYSVHKEIHDFLKENKSETVQNL